jgi:hypothetical protein
MKKVMLVGVFVASLFSGCASAINEVEFSQDGVSQNQLNLDRQECEAKSKSIYKRLRPTEFDPPFAANAAAMKTLDECMAAKGYTSKQGMGRVFLRSIQNSANGNM